MPTTRTLYATVPIYQNDGSVLGWKNCNPTAGAVTKARDTRGRVRLTGAQVRAATGDTEGGTNPQQVDDALAKIAPPDTLSTGYFMPSRMKANVQDGQAMSLSVRYRLVAAEGRRRVAAGLPLVSGIERGFDGWHEVVVDRWLGEGDAVDWPMPAGSKVGPTKHLQGPGWVVLDPLNDGRRRTVAEGPVVWPAQLLDAVVGDSLQYGNKVGGSFTLPGWVVTQTVPTIKLKYGGRKAYRGTYVTKHPARLRSEPRVDPRPNHRLDNLVRWLNRGEQFHVSQASSAAANAKIAGSRLWFGDATGDRWVHSSAVKKV